ncbi:MAG: SPFH domain-containing protein [Clostridiales Family XIII bacterium]|jgi:hypothetical protein|nr:SPFH domain-containing protein [Clostridiales Family XIII bacterium]
MARTDSNAGHGIADIIKYEGDNKTFIWKSPREDFNTTTQLIVHESQEAIFFANGQALDLFGAGRHTLETQNIPLIRNVFNLATGGRTPFHCEVYFINKTEQLAIKWGTDSKVQYLDPVYNFPLSIGASGELALRVEDSRKLLVKIVGTETAMGQEQLIGYFRAFLMAHIKPYIAQIMVDEKISIFEADARIQQFSSELKERLRPDFAEYGLDMTQFFATNIVKPDGDRQYEYFKELHFRQFADIKDAEIKQQVGVIEQQTDAKRMIIEAEAMAGKRRIEGYDYKTERAYDVAEKVAQNEGTGEFASAGMGLGMMGGMGFGVGAVVADVTKDALGPVMGGASPATAPAPVGTPSPPPFVDLKQESRAENHGGTAAAFTCASCGCALPTDAAFCIKCGSSVEARQESYCAGCGAPLPTGSNFCPKCGMPSSQDMQGGETE